MASDNMFSSLSNAARGFGNLPMVRQLGLLLGLSASIALGFAVVLWSQNPNYRPLYTNLTAQETSEVLDALQETGIDFKVDNNSGAVLVPSDQIYDARFKVASTGLLQGSGVGFDMLEKNNSIGTSRFMENARYSHALEGELSRTISSLKNIKSARVHLAIPKDSVFINDNKKARASVFLDLYSSNKLDSSQVSAIVHLVSSSIPNMAPEDISVVDQYGSLLTGGPNAGDLAKSKEQYEYKTKIEDEMAQRIETILIPLLGQNSVRAKVSADINFTQVEQTQESYLPDSQVLRSEQILDEQNGARGGPKGIPGALSNQPPTNVNENQAPTQPEQPIDNANQPADTNGQNKTGRMQATRNYELGKTISYSKLPSGQVKRLSVAVVIDNHKNVDEGGKVKEDPITKEEMDKITQLVENAVGYDKARGDSVSVVNIPFAAPKPIEEPLPLKFWQQTWFWDVVKTSAGGLFVLLLVFFILRPLLQNLAKKAVVPKSSSQADSQQVLQMPAGQAALAAGAQQYALNGPATPMTQQDRWGELKQLAADDPKKIAQIMNNWVGDQ